MSRSLRCHLLFVLICTVLSSHSVFAGQFLEANSYPGGAGTVAIATGDLNGDGKVDVVLGNSSDHTVGVLLGNGDGSFQPPMNFDATKSVDHLAVGDFNKDGHLDVVTVDQSKNEVNILLGNGDGTLQAAVPYPTGLTPEWVSVADVNNDGSLDLVTANKEFPAGKGSISVLLGNGDGTFGPHVEFSNGGSRPSLVAVGDFNKDGKPDVLSTAFSPSANLQLLLGNGDGTFQSPQFIAPIGAANSLVVADFNHDGNLDFASAGLVQSVQIFLGNGDGTFLQGNTYSLFMPATIAAGDVNGDGILDLVGGGSGAAVLIGNGDGTFQLPIYYGSVNGDFYVALADVNGDGKLDFLGTQNNFTLGQLDVLIGIGGGHYLAHRDFDPGGNGSDAAAGDFNGDGKVDLAVVDNAVCCGSYDVGILIGNGDGTFAPNPKKFSTGKLPPTGIAAGDFNRDGKLDLAVVIGGVTILLGNGDGTFQNHMDYGTGIQAFKLVLGDFNSDGKLDVAVANYYSSRIEVYLGNGDGTLQVETDYPVGKYDYQIATGDFNGDGRLDLVVANEGSDSLGVLFGNGDGTFQPQVQINTGSKSAPGLIAVADLNHDGKLDLAFTSNCSDITECFFQASVVLGNGDGTFGPASNYPLPLGNFPGAISVADMNGDGVLDLVTAVDNTGQQISVLLGNGDGTFQPRSDYGGGGLSLAVADFNRDNALDVASTQASASVPFGGILAIQLNTSGTTIRKASSPNPSKQGQAVVFTATVAASLPGQPTPTGKMTWKDGSTTLATVALRQGKAQFTTSSLSVGQHTISVSYSGGGQFQANKAQPLIQVVNP